MSDAESDTIRTRLRKLPSLTGPLWTFRPDTAPSAPQPLFAEWLRFAIDVGIREPHAMTLSTVDEDSFPDARTLILKDLDEAWYFATDALSPKGRQIDREPRVALTFYWPRLGRQVRIKGVARAMPRAAGAEDFRARSQSARAVALLGRQSQHLASAAELAGACDAAVAKLEGDPNFASPSWTLYAVAPSEVEFWQGQASRRHMRLIYRSSPEGWSKSMLWP